MSDPERLLDSDGVDPEVRELLKSLRDISPGAGTAAGSWGRMAAKVAALPVLAAASSTVAAHVAGASQVGRFGASAWKALGFKLALGALASTVVGVGWVSLHADRTAQVFVPSRTAPVVQSSAAVATLEVPTAAAPPMPMAAPDKPALPSAATRRSLLDEEASMLAKVRSALRKGDAHAASVALGQLQSTFPAGQLVQERDVLWVEVLAASGNATAARRKAQAFIAAHPRSPHSVKLARYVEGR